jgi:hypothetical protein
MAFVADAGLGRRYYTEAEAQSERAKYTVAWICALADEFSIAKKMFDEVYSPLPPKGGDRNAYRYGRIANRNVVMVSMPKYGNNVAAATATSLYSTFENLKYTVLVGIGGGVPSSVSDIHVGDVIVGERVRQYDLRKNQGTISVPLASNLTPGNDIMRIVIDLQSDHILVGKKYIVLVTGWCNIRIRYHANTTAAAVSRATVRISPRGIRFGPKGLTFTMG